MSSSCRRVQSWPATVCVKGAFSIQIDDGLWNFPTIKLGKSINDLYRVESKINQTWIFIFYWDPFCVMHAVFYPKMYECSCSIMNHYCSMIDFHYAICVSWTNIIYLWRLKVFKNIFTWLPHIHLVKPSYF